MARRPGSRVSIHAPRAGRDHFAGAGHDAANGFNPRAPRGARRPPRRHVPRRLSVSIHAPRAGRDGQAFEAVHGQECFNPRAPRGARPEPALNRVIVPAFQSTRPARGATCPARYAPYPRPCFNPRAPRGARLVIHIRPTQRSLFQSTRPARGATRRKHYLGRGVWFQSTRPARGATHSPGCDLVRRFVSIHAPRAGRDSGVNTTLGTASGFNPRAPRGARHHHMIRALYRSTFQSTRPARGATQVVDVGADGSVFQSTRPARGATSSSMTARPWLSFQSTRPARGATGPPWCLTISAQVSIHAPRAGRDWSRRS